MEVGRQVGTGVVADSSSSTPAAHHDDAVPRDDHVMTDDRPYFWHREERTSLRRLVAVPRSLQCSESLGPTTLARRTWMERLPEPRGERIVHLATPSLHLQCLGARISIHDGVAADALPPQMANLGRFAWVMLTEDICPKIKC